LDEFLALRFPRLEFDYVQAIEFDGEAVRHDMTARVNKIGRAVLLLEEFYQNGAEVTQVEPEPELLTDDEDD
jgi:hypothetical protein